jgi:hypothetical protein
MTGELLSDPSSDLSSMISLLSLTQRESENWPKFGEAKMVLWMIRVGGSHNDRLTPPQREGSAAHHDDKNKSQCLSYRHQRPHPLRDVLSYTGRKADWRTVVATQINGILR